MTFRAFAIVAAGMAAGGLAGGVAAQDLPKGFDPGAPCGPILRAAGDLDKLMVAAWSLGARAPQMPVTLEAVRAELGLLFTACVSDETRPLAALAAPAGARPETPAPAGDGGSRADAERMLRRFLEPGADLAALTGALKPEPEDVRAVYAEPLAGRLIESYGTMFTPGVQFGPKPEQTDLLVYHTTTGALKGGWPGDGAFPGGYGEVLRYFMGNQPIVRFKFVRPGETIGLAFDGLIYVNGRWVLMPKPWRSLE